MEKIGELEKKNGGWLEPAKNFLTTCNEASSIANRATSSTKRHFIEIFGSNFTLRDRSLLFSKRKPFCYIAKGPLEEDWLPDSESVQTIDIILPNTIHGCKKKDL